METSSETRIQMRIYWGRSGQLQEPEAERIMNSTATGATVITEVSVSEPEVNLVCVLEEAGVLPTLMQKYKGTLSTTQKFAGREKDFLG